jgi:hypothetical protein
VLTEPIISLIAFVAGRLDELVGGLVGLLAVIPEVITIPWPFVWLPYEPFLFGLVVVAGSAAFAAVVKGVRWLYGLVPFVQ